MPRDTKTEKEIREQGVTRFQKKIDSFSLAFQAKLNDCFALLKDVNDSLSHSDREAIRKLVLDTKNLETSLKVTVAKTKQKILREK
jgi:hypothetical protein